VSPLVRKLAHELGVDLARVAGSGRNGAITRDDVQDAAKAATPTPSRPAVTPYARRLATELGVDLAALHEEHRATIRAADVRAAAGQAPLATTPRADGGAPPPLPRAARGERMRATIAASMSRSKREIPHYYLSTTVDLERATTWMHAYNGTVPVSGRLIPAVLLLKATAAAARAAPDLNGFWVGDRFEPAPAVHLGVAVSLRGGGLVAPAIHDAADLPLEELMRRLRDLVARARAGRLRATELSDPTLTVTNLGEQGVEAVFGVIYPPQVALVGLGRVQPRTCVVDGLIGVHPTTTVTLSADHRATDGFRGSRFLADIDDRLQRPEEL
jgi:pyruvate dehydrogenase E2 component (dihydrolipoamide acetyltransferase)